MANCDELRKRVFAGIDRLRMDCSDILNTVNDMQCSEKERRVYLHVMKGLLSLAISDTISAIINSETKERGEE